MEVLYHMQRDAEVAPKCLLRSLVRRKKRDGLERALEARERHGEERREGRETRVIVGCTTT